MAQAAALIMSARGGHHTRKAMTIASLELRAAQARLQYWTDELERARESGDESGRARAAQFVAEYEQFIANIAGTEPQPGGEHGKERD